MRQVGWVMGGLPRCCFRRADCRHLREQTARANQYVKIPIVTSIGYARNIIVVKSAQTVIAAVGSYRTLRKSVAEKWHSIIGLDMEAIAKNKIIR